jgi:imidazolonepropionase-like amidohydrolase
MFLSRVPESIPVIVPRYIPILASPAIVSRRVEHSLPATNAAEVIDATDLMLCPGFIDMHAHTALESFRDTRLEPKVAQGFTTEVINPDGAGGLQ